MRTLAIRRCPLILLSPSQALQSFPSRISSPISDKETGLLSALVRRGSSHRLHHLWLFVLVFTIRFLAFFRPVLFVFTPDAFLIFRFSILFPWDADRRDAVGSLCHKPVVSAIGCRWKPLTMIGCHRALLTGCHRLQVFRVIVRFVTTIFRHLHLL